MGIPNKRLEKIEQSIPPDAEPQFFAWLDNPWTEAEKEEALRKHPEQRIFIKSLSRTIPTDLMHE